MGNGLSSPNPGWRGRLRNIKVRRATGDTAPLPNIPRTIWQTWKSADDPKWATHEDSWRRFNPGWTHNLVDDAGCRAYVKAHFPTWLGMYDKLPKAVMKADVWRYMVIYQEGGVYADIDTLCTAPIDTWLLGTPIENQAGQARLITNLEFSNGQLVQWTFAAAPRHPALLAVLHAVWGALDKMNFDHPISEDMILDITGPRLFTAAIANTLGMSDASDFSESAFWDSKGLGVAVLPHGMFGSTRSGRWDKLYWPEVVMHDYHGFDEKDGWKHTLVSAPPKKKGGVHALGLYMILAIIGLILVVLFFKDKSNISI